jgi:protein-disulfide isomerase
MVSAEAAECAGLQGKFWEMHDKVFLNQDDWSGNAQALEVFLGYADELELDTAAFNTCMGEHQTQQKIEEDRTFGQQIGVPATPAFLVRGKGVEQPYPIVGAYPYEEFVTAIETVSGQ